MHNKHKHQLKNPNLKKILLKLIICYFQKRISNLSLDFIGVIMKRLYILDIYNNINNFDELGKLFTFLNRQKTIKRLRNYGLALVNVDIKVLLRYRSSSTL